MEDELNFDKIKAQVKVESDSTEKESEILILVLTQNLIGFGPIYSENT
jgi:hypothetical protein